MLVLMFTTKAASKNYKHGFYSASWKIFLQYCHELFLQHLSKRIRQEVVFSVFYSKFQVIKWSVFKFMCVWRVCVQCLISRLLIWALRGDQTTTVVWFQYFGNYAPHHLFLALSYDFSIPTLEVVVWKVNISLS